MNRYAILLGKEPTEQELEDSKKFQTKTRTDGMKEGFRKLYGGYPQPQYPGPREPAGSIFFQEFQYGQRDPRPDITEIIPARNLSPEQAHILTHGLSRLSQEAGIAIMVNNQRIGRVQNWEPSGREEIPGGRAIQYPADITLRMTATGRSSSTNPDLQNIPVRTEEGHRILQSLEPPPLRGQAQITAMLDDVGFDPIEQRIYDLCKDS